MGSYFKGMLKHEWKKALPRLRTSLDGEIESILKFSYDALCDEDKYLFLYIACFFRNQSIEKVKAYLANNFCDVEQGFHVLADKSLISISSGNIEMHDLLARLDREIVRKQSIHDPGQRQFLVDTRDICKLMNNDTVSGGSDIGAIINFSGIKDELNICDNALERMSCLHFLRVHDYSHNPRKVRLVDYGYNHSRSYLQQSLNNLPRKVRLLDYDNFSRTCLPSNFNPEFLVELKMRNSKLRKLWEGFKMIRNLRWMDLRYSYNLRELPDLSTATNLHELNLSCCSSLVELPSSIGNAINLRKLLLHKCLSLIELPSSIGSAINLEELDLSCCLSLVKLSFSIGNAANLQKLNLSGCWSLVELPSSIGNAIKLHRLNLSDCRSLVELPSSIGNATNLEVLNLSGCSSLLELPSFTGNAAKLRSLNLSGCSSLMELPSFIWNVINDKQLNLSGCSSLVELPSSIGNDIKVHHLTLSGCSSLVELPSFIGNVTSLENLDLSGCSSLVELPSSIGNATKLDHLNLNGCSRLAILPSSIGNLTSLWKLDLCGCSSLVKLPSSMGNLHKLSFLRLKGCSKLEAIPININMESLHRLDITDCLLLKKCPEISTNIEFPGLTETAIEEVPSSISSCRYLELCISYRENLVEFSNAFKYFRELHVSDTRIQEIAPWIKELSRLQKLVIKGCTKLVSLPQLPCSLEILDAENCESLERLDCSFHNNKFIALNFGNCFKLNQEARDLIIKTSSCNNVILPGEKVPTHYTYRATGSSVSAKLNGTDTHFPRFLSFKACFLLVNKGDVEVRNWTNVEVTYRVMQKQNGVNVEQRRYHHQRPLLKEHLYTFNVEAKVRSRELVFEFEVNNEKLEIGECGILHPKPQQYHLCDIGLMSN